MSLKQFQKQTANFSDSLSFSNQHSELIAKTQENNKTRFHRTLLKSVKMFFPIMLFIIICTLPALCLADTQQCTNMTAYYCGGLSPSTPISNRCLPRIKYLYANVIAVDTITTNPLIKRLTFIVTHLAKGFHTYGTHCFNATVYARVDNYRAESAGGSSTMSLLPWDAYAICATIGNENCYQVTVTESSEQLKFWARAWQRSSQGYDECGCTSDTLVFSNPINLDVGDSRALYINPLDNELGPIPCQAQVGDPINTMNGNLYFDRNDINLGTDLGIPFVLSRHYNSHSVNDYASMGRGWRHSLEYDLSHDTSSAEYTLTEATGRRISIKQHDLVQGANQQTKYSLPPNTSYQFDVDTATGVCILKRHNGISLYFGSSGKPDSLKDLAGNLTQLYYSSDKLDSLKNSSDRKLFFNYSDSSLINICSSLGDTLVEYDYYDTTGRLRRVTYADDSYESYTYGDSTYDTGRIVSISSSDSVFRNYAYDTMSLASTYYRGDGFEKVDLE